MNEANYWRQRYEMLMANLSDAVRAATAQKPVMLADKESYELGKLHGERDEREACAAILDANAMACESPIMRSLLQSNAQAIRVRGQA